MSSAPRRRSRWLAVFSLPATALVCCACVSGTAEAPRRVSLAQLAFHETNFEGRTIEIQGIVRQFAEPGRSGYFILEDTRQNRLELEPAGAVDSYSNHPVDVVGTFQFDGQHGRRLSVRQVRPIDGTQ